MAVIDIVQWKSRKGVYAVKHPKTELGTWTQLIVAETQEAMLMKEGVFEGPFPPGRHTLSTKNFPFLSKLVNIPFGGESPFTADVWFVNQASQLDVKWGTRNAMLLKDPVYNVMLPVRAFGQFGIRITHTKKFLGTLVGTLPSFGEEQLQSYFKGIVLSRAKDGIATYLVNKGKSILEIAAELSGISSELETALNVEFQEFGITLTKFRVVSIHTDEEHEGVTALRHALAEKAKMDIMGYNYQQQRSFDVMETAASNEGQAGNVMGAGMGLGMGVGIGGGMGNQFQQMSNQMQTSGPPTPPPMNPFGGGGPAPTKEFFVHLNGQRMGPYPVSTLQQGVASGQFNPQTPVWCEGMAGWQPAGQVPALQGLFNPGGPPPFGQ